MNMSSDEGRVTDSGTFLGSPAVIQPIGSGSSYEGPYSMSSGALPVQQPAVPGLAHSSYQSDHSGSNYGSTTKYPGRQRRPTIQEAVRSHKKKVNALADFLNKHETISKLYDEENVDISRVPVHPLTLRFHDKALENAFQTRAQIDISRMHRKIYWVGFIFFLVASPIIFMSAPSIWPPIIIAGSLFLPLYCTLISLTYRTAFYNRNYPWIVALAVTLMFVDIMIIGLFGFLQEEDETDQGHKHSGSTPAFLLVFALFVSSNLRFVIASGVGLGLVATHLGMAFVSQQRVHVKEIISWSIFYSILVLIGMTVSYVNEREQRARFLNRRALIARAQRMRLQHRQSRALLRNLFPDSVVTQLLEGNEEMLDAYNQVAVAYVSLSNADVSQAESPAVAFSQLCTVIEVLDNLVTANEVEKIKSSQTTMLLAVGLHDTEFRPAMRLASFLLKLIAIYQDESSRFRVAIRALESSLQTKIELKVGLHTGSVIAGVIGKSKVQYDVWGQTVNIAAKVMEYALPNTVFCSNVVQAQLRDEYDITDHTVMTSASNVLGAVGERQIETLYIIREKGTNETPVKKQTSSSLLSALQGTHSDSLEELPALTPPRGVSDSVRSTTLPRADDSGQQSADRQGISDVQQSAEKPAFIDADVGDVNLEVFDEVKDNTPNLISALGGVYNQQVRRGRSASVNSTASNDVSGTCDSTLDEQDIDDPQVTLAAMIEDHKAGRSNLRWGPDTWKRYKAYSSAKYIPFLRVHICLGAVMFILYGAVDFIIFPSVDLVYPFVELFALTPMLLWGLMSLSLLKLYPKLYEYIVLSIVVLIGLTLAAIVPPMPDELVFWYKHKIITSTAYALTFTVMHASWLSGTWAIFVVAATGLLALRDFSPSATGSILGMYVLAAVSLHLMNRVLRYHFVMTEQVAIRNAFLEHEEKLVVILLESCAPRKIVQSMRTADSITVDLFAEYPLVTVLYCRVELAELHPKPGPANIALLVNLRSALYSAFVETAEEHQSTKLKTTQDSFVCITGVPDPVTDHFEQALQIAFEFQDTVAHLFRTLFQEGEDRYGVNLTFGIASGSCVGGVVGDEKWTFDCWGKVVETAHTIERTSTMINTIRIDEGAHKFLLGGYLADDVMVSPGPPIAGPDGNAVGQTFIVRPHSTIINKDMDATSSYG